MDVKALYHSLKKEVVTGIVEEEMYNSGMIVNGVDGRKWGSIWWFYVGMKDWRVATCRIYFQEGPKEPGNDV